MAVLMFPDSVWFLDEKIAEQGEDEVVLAPESQMIALLSGLKKKEDSAAV